MVNALVSFAAMWCVVVIHANNHFGVEGSLLREFVVPALTQWAVPWFFLLSGFFFVQSLQKYSVATIMRKKVKSLLVPYLVWCLVGAAVMGSVLSYKRTFSDVFGFFSCFPSGNPTLWFVHALMGFMLLSLVLWLLATVAIKPGQYRLNCFCIAYCAVICAALCAFRGGGMGTPTSPFFFGLGMGMFSLRGHRVSRWFCSLSNCSLAGLFVVFLLLRIVGRMVDRGILEMVVRNCSVVILIVVIWSGVNKIVAWRGETSVKVLPRWLKMTFFVYCAHYPIIVLIDSVAEKVFGDVRFFGDVVFWVISLLLPMFLVAVGTFLDGRCPRVMKLLLGGR